VVQGGIGSNGSLMMLFSRKLRKSRFKMEHTVFAQLHDHAGGRNLCLKLLMYSRA